MTAAQNNALLGRQRRLTEMLILRPGFVQLSQEDVLRKSGTISEKYVWTEPCARARQARSTAQAAEDLTCTTM